MGIHKYLNCEIDTIEYQFSIYRVDYKEWKKAYDRYKEIEKMSFEDKEDILNRLGIILIDSSNNIDLSTLEKDSFVRLCARNNLKNAINDLKNNSGNSKKLTK